MVGDRRLGLVSDIKEETPKTKKKMGAFGGAMVMLLIGLLMIIACGVLLYFNLFGVRNLTLSLLQGGTTPYKNQLDRINSDMQWLVEREEELVWREEECQLWEEDLEQKKQALEEAQILFEENQSKQKTAEEMDAAHKAELKLLAEYYQQMKPENAAAILEQLPSVQETAEIIQVIEKAQATAILECMDVRLAAMITRRIYSENAPD